MTPTKYPIAASLVTRGLGMARTGDITGAKEEIAHVVAHVIALVGFPIERRARMGRAMGLPLGESRPFVTHRVKLTDEVAHTMMRGCTPGGRRKTTVDWYKRRGTIVRRGYPTWRRYN